MELTESTSLPSPDATPNTEVIQPPKGLWRETFESLLHKPSAVLGMTILTILILMALFAPLIAPYDPTKKLLDIPQEGAIGRASPCIHLLGCPKAGEDIVSIVSPDQRVSSVGLIEERLLLVKGNTVEVWKAETKEQLFTLTHDEPVTAAAWRADQAILTASGDHLYIWKEREIIEEFETEGGVDFLLWTSDGTRFVSGNAQTINFWFDCGTADFAPSCLGQKDWVNEGTAELENDWQNIQWHSDRPELMVASGNIVQLWDSTNGFARTIATYEHDGLVTSARYNKRGSRILTTSGNSIQTWQASSPYEEISHFEYDTPLSNGSWGEQTRSGEEIVNVAATSGNTLIIWNRTNGEIIHEISAENEDEPFIGSAVSPLGTQYLAYTSHTVYVWDAESEEQVFANSGEEPILRVAWRLPNGGSILVARNHDAKIIKTVNFQYLLGIDGSVRDQFSRLVYGARVSLRVGITSVTLAIVVGTIVGLVAGFVGGWTDNIMMRIMDVMLAFPALILAIAVVTILGPGLNNALIAISIVFIPAYARVARAGALSVKEYDFVAADRALGVAPARILFRRILPNVLAPLIVQATLGIGTAILDAAALSFLGLGAQPPLAEWGRMLSEERAQFATAPHLVIFPGIAIMVTVLAFNLLGDGLRDALDPRLNR
jgi:ABC-type dipeptide/oligopeptide/nickel transport system permease subunit